MKKFRILFLFVISLNISLAESITKIVGFAPKYIGEKVEIYAIEDYFSMKEKLIASTVVQADSMFTVNFFNSKTQKIIIKSANNKGFIYIQPNAVYEIYFPLRNKYDEYRPLGNDVEISFNNLTEEDINYKILSFEKWKNNFLGMYFYEKSLKPIEFQNKLDTFKINVQKAFEKDSSFYFQTYVRFTIAEMDNIQFQGNRNRFEKYNYYLKSYPVVYENDVYMSYLKSFYTNIFTRLSMETNNKIYLGILKSSPTLVANALSNEYTLKNMQLIELVMVKSLSDSYFKSDFPQTNILSILDSVSKLSFFPTNGLIAKNLIEKLTEILPGSKAPDFNIKDYVSDAYFSLTNFEKKHLYIQFIDLNIKECETEVELLKSISAKYKSDVEVITVFLKQASYSKKQTEFLKNIYWKKFEISMDNDLIRNYKIQSFPSYVLIDAYGYVVESPALKPSPDGKYETIDKTFFYIQKINQEEKK